MRIHPVFAAFLLFAVTALHAQHDYDPDLYGYVTQVTSPTEVDVNGTHVRIDSGTQFFTKAANKLSRIEATGVKLYIGQNVEVYGKQHNKEHTIEATQLNLLQPNPVDVDGFGVVDASFESSTPGRPTLRADGYVIRIPEKCTLSFDSSLSAATAFDTNIWITFHGTQGPDGVVVADKARFRTNTIEDSEGHLRAKTEHDPSAVDTNAKQTTASKVFRGIDPKQIPPYNDAAMQARVSAIGEKLIPSYQRQLPDSDPTRIEFRFQLVDEPHWHYTLDWPNGIILIPYQVVERLKNDSQLAAVLADDIASVLEKQFYRYLPARHSMFAAQIAGDIGGAFVPGLGLATLATNSVVGSKMMQHIMGQSSRVSLCLMHDAGYDVTEAPRAWWLLADTKSKGLDRTPLPARSKYLYKFLGETWRGQ